MYHIIKHIFLLCIVCLFSINSSAQNKLNENGVYLNSELNLNSNQTTLSINPCPPPIITNRFASNINITTGIAFDGNYLWVTGQSEFEIDQLSPVDGTVIRSIPINIYTPFSMTFAHNHLWVIDKIYNRVRKIDTTNGNEITSFPTPNNGPRGIASDGVNFWLYDSLVDSAYVIDTLGNILKQFPTNPAHDYVGLYWDGQSLWTNGLGFLQILKIDTSTFSIVECIDMPGGGLGIGLTFDGQHLWMSNNSSDSIYQIDIAPFTTNISQTQEHKRPQIKLAPVPFHDFFTLEYDQLKVTEIRIFNLLGQEQHIMFTSAENRIRIDGAHLEKGVYFIVVSDRMGIVDKIKTIKI